MNKFLFGRLIYLTLFILLLLSVTHSSTFAQGTTTDNSCKNEYPAYPPNLYQVSMSSSSATVYFVEPPTLFDGYTISYGLSQNADTYNVSYNQGHLDGANKYVIHDLYPKMEYFFKVRADNGCAPGPWSAVLSTKPKELPVTGPSNVWMFGILGIALVFAGTTLAVKFK